MRVEASILPHLISSIRNAVSGMKFAAILCIFAVAWLIVPGPANAGVSPSRMITAPGLTVVLAQTQSSGSTKIRKECEVKGEKQGLKGLTLQAYVEQCMSVLSFSTQYGVMNSK